MFLPCHFLSTELQAGYSIFYRLAEYCGCDLQPLYPVTRNTRTTHTSCVPHDKRTFVYLIFHCLFTELQAGHCVRHRVAEYCWLDLEPLYPVTRHTGTTHTGCISQNKPGRLREVQADWTCHKLWGVFYRLWSQVGLWCLMKSWKSYIFTSISVCVCVFVRLASKLTCKPLDQFSWSFPQNVTYVIDQIKLKGHGHSDKKKTKQKKKNLRNTKKKRKSPKI